MLKQCHHVSRKVWYFCCLPGGRAEVLCPVGPPLLLSDHSVPRGSIPVGPLEASLFPCLAAGRPPSHSAGQHALRQGGTVASHPGGFLSGEEAQLTLSPISLQNHNCYRREHIC